MSVFEFMSEVFLRTVGRRRNGKIPNESLDAVYIEISSTTALTSEPAVHSFIMRERQRERESSDLEVRGSDFLKFGSLLA